MAFMGLIGLIGACGGYLRRVGGNCEGECWVVEWVVGMGVVWCGYGSEYGE